MFDGQSIEFSIQVMLVFLGLAIVIGVLAGILGNAFSNNLKLAKLNRKEACTTCPHKDATEAFMCRGCKIGMGQIKTARNAKALDGLALPRNGLADGDDESLKVFKKGGAA